MANPHSLTLEDFADIDLFYALEDAADPDGWATSEEIAKAIGIDNEHPNACVGIRLGWMNRYGFMEKEVEKGLTKWRLNEVGYNLLTPEKLPAAVERALSKLDEAQRAQITDMIAREMPQASRQAAHLARRTWKHHWMGWSDPKITPKPKEA